MATRKAPQPFQTPKQAEAMRATFASLLHSPESAESKVILLELARRGGGKTNYADLARALKSSVGSLDRACHGLERRGIIQRHASDVISLTERNLDLVEMLGVLAAPVAEDEEVLE